MRIRGRLILLVIVGVLFVPQLIHVYSVGFGRAGGCKTKKDGRGEMVPVRVRIDVSKYPANWRHIVDARQGRNTLSDGETVVSNGLRWPTVLVKNSHGEDRRRQAAFRIAGLAGKTKRGMARDEYPPAMGRSTMAADVRFVPARANSAQGSSMGGQMRPYCDGQTFVLVAVP